MDWTSIIMISIIFIVILIVIIAYGIASIDTASAIDEAGDDLTNILGDIGNDIARIGDQHGNINAVFEDAENIVDSYREGLHTSLLGTGCTGPFDCPISTAKCNLLWNIALVNNVPFDAIACNMGARFANTMQSLSYMDTQMNKLVDHVNEIDMKICGSDYDPECPDP